ncbi:hypothetical protein [Weissella paramesenteroides]|uniref:hypothetical protein n=1 Tax=Weissella paramesenteroides TaxID=1249 RepID=UPI001239D9DA|nr:hypothetical protein [Weissella paramesenteroides]KAA8446954.1 hypothetical protein FKV72_03945 [Weissella paramesenteroides]KAA8450590.1 hypothetical protein FKV71_08635 [Weissella paramesenteroides]
MMTNKAYIVANEQQEREVLNKLYSQGKKWNQLDNYVIPRKQYYVSLPYVIYEYGYSNYLKFGRVPKIKYSTEIVYDGRKEEQMSKKYVVSQEFMDALERWKDTLDSNDYVSIRKLNALPVKINNWRWCHDNKEKNNRLIAIIRWVNGEDVFEVKKPNKWVVRSKEHNNFCEYTYVTTDDIFSLAITMGVENATRFDTKEEAQSWANSHQEVIEVE